DVDDRSSVLDHPARRRGRNVRIEMDAAVGERVGRDVHDTHHRRAKKPLLDWDHGANPRMRLPEWLKQFHSAADNRLAMIDDRLLDHWQRESAARARLRDSLPASWRDDPRP